MSSLNKLQCRSVLNTQAGTEELQTKTVEFFQESLKRVPVYFSYHRSVLE